jgi:hypothetical protein
MWIRGTLVGLDALTGGEGSGCLCSVPSEDLRRDEIEALCRGFYGRDVAGSRLSVISAVKPLQSPVVRFLSRSMLAWLRDRRSDDAATDEPRQSRGPRDRMTTKEAYDVLGLEADTREDEIRAAHPPSRSGRIDLSRHPYQRGKRSSARALRKPNDGQSRCVHRHGEENSWREAGLSLLACNRLRRNRCPAS